jgi:hypothetical protein
MTVEYIRCCIAEPERRAAFERSWPVTFANPGSPLAESRQSGADGLNRHRQRQVGVSCLSPAANTCQGQRHFGVLDGTG